MKILIVQRKYLHYRRLLIDYLRKDCNLDIVVVDTNNDKYISSDGYIGLKSFIKRVNLFGKSYELYYSRELIDYIKNNARKYDVIVLEGTTNVINNFFIYRILEASRVPYIWWDAGRRIGARMTPARKLIQPIVKKIMLSANACIAYSSVAKEYMRSVGVPEDRIFVCNNTINTSYFDKIIREIKEEDISELRIRHNLDGKQIILYVGALEERKKVQDLINAYKINKCNNPEIALVIVGNGEYRNILENIVKQLKLDDVVFTGSIIDDVIKYFLLCDIFVLPSEGGLALNQAMLCAKPVIASSADGTERDLIINGYNGYIFNEGDINQLAKLLESMLGDQITLQKIGFHSRKIIDEKINEQMFAVEFKKAIEFTIRTA